MESEKAKARVFRRIEKILVTLESMLVAIFIWLFGVPWLGKSLGSLIAFWTFIFVVTYKRKKIEKERGSKKE